MSLHIFVIASALSFKLLVIPHSCYRKKRGAFADFSWYEEWAKEAQAEPVLAWLASTRTELVHKSALEPFSTLEIRCLGNPRMPHGIDENPLLKKVSPFVCTHYYINQGPQEDHAHEFIRYWGIDSLPKFELLDACSVAYDQLDDLVGLAHKKLEMKLKSYRTPDSKRNLPCMENTLRHRVSHTVIRDGLEIWEDEPPGLHENS